MSLPKQIQEQIRAAEQIDRLIAAEKEMKPRKGRPPKEQATLNKTVVLSALSNDGLNDICETLCEVVGRKARGNKRRGEAALYTDLLQYFLLLKSKGITLPRNGSLSLKACMYGLFEILQRHGYTGSEAGLKNRIQRDKIACTAPN